jgi:hypothetical protein
VLLSFAFSEVRETSRSGPAFPAILGFRDEDTAPCTRPPDDVPGSEQSAGGIIGDVHLIAAGVLVGNKAGPNVLPPSLERIDQTRNCSSLRPSNEPMS